MRTLPPLLLLTLTTLARADEVRIEPVRDGTLYEDANGALANGAGEHLFAGTTAIGEIRRLLVAFDVAAHVPKGSTLTGVTLELFMSKTVSFNHEFSLHRVTADWGEGDSDAPLEEGGGAPSERDDATWVHRMYPTTKWATLGGDFDPTPSGTFWLDPPGKYFLFSAGITADVQAWLDGSQPDHGWLLKLVDETLLTTAKRFDSRESGLAFFRPTLVIQFTPVEIGTRYCGPAVPNSSGAGGEIRAYGSVVAADNAVFLRATSLPLNQFGYFLNSQTQGFVMNPGGSQGNLCLGGLIGRYTGLLGSTGDAGELGAPLDLPHTPTPNGLVAVQPGETWNFTCWFRDVNPVQTSNFTDGVSIGFQ